MEPASGTFRTSWRTQLVWVGGSAVALIVALGVIMWLDGALRDPVAALFVFGFTGVYVVAWSLWFRLGGVVEVRVSPEAVVVQSHGGSERRVDRSDLVEAWQDKRWVLRTRYQKVVIRDEGFTTDDWVALSGLLSAWKLDGEGGALPGVVTPPESCDPEAVVFEVHRPHVPWVVVAVVSLGLLGVGALSAASYRDGSWAEVPMITLALPLFGVASAVFLMRGLPGAVRRATFLPEKVRFERLVGSERTVSYEDIVDAFGAYVDTRAGTFFVGHRNADVFARLLDERLEDGQLAGRRLAESALMLRPGFIISFLAGVPVLWFIAARLGGGWGLTEAWTEVLVLAVLIAYGFLLGTGAKLMVRYILRHADD